MSWKKAKVFEDGYMQGVHDTFKALERYLTTVSLEHEAKIAELLRKNKNKSCAEYMQDDKE